MHSLWQHTAAPCAWLQFESFAHKAPSGWPPAVPPPLPPAEVVPPLLLELPPEDVVPPIAPVDDPPVEVLPLEPPEVALPPVDGPVPDEPPVVAMPPPLPDVPPDDVELSTESSLQAAIAQNTMSEVQTSRAVMRASIA